MKFALHDLEVMGSNPSHIQPGLSGSSESVNYLVPEYLPQYSAWWMSVCQRSNLVDELKWPCAHLVDVSARDAWWMSVCMMAMCTLGEIDM